MCAQAQARATHGRKDPETTTESQVLLGPGWVVGAMGHGTGGWHSGAGPAGLRALLDPVRARVPSSPHSGPGPSLRTCHTPTLRQHHQGNSGLEMRPRDQRGCGSSRGGTAGGRRGPASVCAQRGAHSERSGQKGRKASRREHGAQGARREDRQLPTPSPFISGASSKVGRRFNDQQERLPDPSLLNN